MKFFTAVCIATVAALGVASGARDATEAQAASASALKVRIRSHGVQHEVHTVEASATTHSKRMTAKQFARVAQLKSTPWDAQPEVKAAKCGDLCELMGFYSFQQSRNCDFRPTALCMQYKLGHAAMETVLVTAECECDDTESASAEASESASGSEAVGSDSA